MRSRFAWEADVPASLLNGPPGAISAHVRCMRATQYRDLQGRPGQVMEPGNVYEIPRSELRLLVLSGFVELVEAP